MTADPPAPTFAQICRDHAARFHLAARAAHRDGDDATADRLFIRALQWEQAAEDGDLSGMWEAP